MARLPPVTAPPSAASPRAAPSSATVQALLPARALRRSHDPADLLAAAAREKLRLVLASAWESEDVKLDAPLTAELGGWRELLAGYDATFDELSAAVPGLLRVKGRALADLYPPGWVRDSHDLDVFAPDVPTLWRAAAHLDARGWEATALSMVSVDGEPGAVLVMTGSTRHPFTCGRPHAELSTLAFAGDGSLAPRASFGDAPGLVRHLVALAEEQLQRPLAGRDALDAALAWAALGADERAALWRLLGELALWPEWCRLVQRARPLSAGDGPLVPPGAQLQCAVALSRRSAGRASALRSRGAVAHRVVQALERRPSRGKAIARRVHRRVSPVEVMRAGRPVYAVRIGGAVRRGPLGVVARPDGQMLARTPLGDFAFVYARGGDESWLKRA